MVMNAAEIPGGMVRKRFPFLVFLAFLLLFMGGSVSADSPATTTTSTVTTTVTTVTAQPLSDRTGGSIYFETVPSGAKVWLDTREIGISPFTYYSERTGTMEVRAWKKGYENYTGQVTVVEGTRVIFSIDLKEAPRVSITEPLPPPSAVTTATTIRKSTLAIPTTWPETTPASPADSSSVLGAAALGALLFVMRRR